jgi:hypothetical protein
MDDETKRRDATLDAMFVLLQQMNKQVVALGNTVLMLKSDAADPARPKPAPPLSLIDPKK